MKKINLDNIITESRNENSHNLDSKSTKQILQIINNEDMKIALAIEEQIDVITKIVNLVYATILKKGRVFYLGAGSSGRIGVLDASEMLPTYGVSDAFYGIIAGGDVALRLPVEGAEDSTELAVQDLQRYSFSKKDMVIVIGASGRTPYCIGALEYAKWMQANSAAICMTTNSEFAKYTELVAEIISGPEVVTGSTRMKAGTATKMVVNMISTATMIKLGKVYDNLMVDVQASNEKLVNRCIKIVKEITLVEDEQLIIETLQKAEMKVKPAIVMLIKNTDYSKAIELLNKHKNSLREVLEND